MPSFNLANFDAAMKHMYPYKKVENLVYDNNPLLAMIPKETKFPGRNATYAVEYGVTPGRSANFQTAQNNRGGTKLQDFVVTRIKDYAVVSLDNETLLAADGNEGSLLDVAKSKTDSALLAMSRTMGRDVFRSGNGSIGINDQSVSSGTGTTITLTNANDIVNFETGMRISSVSNADPAAALYANGAAVEITGIDRDAGTLTIATAMEAVWGGGSAIAADSALIPEGDAQNGGSALKMTGLDAWIPATVTSASYWGVDRTQDSTRLGGQRIAYNSDLSKVRHIIKAGTRLAREGGRPDCVFVNPMALELIAAELEGHGSIATPAIASAVPAASQRRYNGKDAAVQFGFTSISVATPAGVVDLISDHNCPSGVAYMLQMNTWALKSLGAAPRMLDFDGIKGLREANSDGVEYRWGYYGNLLCKAPAYNCRIAFA